MTQLPNITIALIGNPNCGKTTLFNGLTGSKQRVGNWPGVTVEKKTGHYRFASRTVIVIDLPGTYSLDVIDDTISIDEKLARDFVQSGQADLFVNIVDASNLERNLYLTAQLAEIGVPLLIALNMTDVALARGLQIDTQKLVQLTGYPVVPMVASDAVGLEHLKQVVQTHVGQSFNQKMQAHYSDAIEQAIAAIQLSIEQCAGEPAGTSRWLAIRLLEGDTSAQVAVDQQTSSLAMQLSAKLGEELDLTIADTRYSLANRLYQDVVKHTGQVGRNLTDQIDRIVLNRFLGIPIFLLMMYLMFLFTINIGGAFIDFFDQSFAAVFVDGMSELLQANAAPDWLNVALSKGLGGGIQTVATFVPIIGFLYLFLSVLEDSGYMARAAFVMDRFMRLIGLPGKSFVPLIVGFGCNVPAIMATRTLENRRDRLMTIAMAPFMSCGARLPVYVLFAAAFFPTNAQNIVFSLYLIGIVIAVLTGLVLKNTLLKGEAAPFILELPPYHLPTVKGVLRHTWGRLKGFLVRAGRIIVPMVLALNFLNSVGTDGSFNNEDSESSVLAQLGRTIAPAFAPFGLNEQNWPAAVGIFTGILAKEAVVGTLNATYSALADKGADTQQTEQPFELREALRAAVDTVPENLLKVVESWLDPLGLQLGDLSDQNAAASKAEVSVSTFGAMAQRFDGPAGAFAYLLFILLYFPCTAATAAVVQESSYRWGIFVVSWTTGLAYSLATLWYQIANFGREPVTSASWVIVIVSSAALTLFTLHRLSHQQQTVASMGSAH